MRLSILLAIMIVLFGGCGISTYDTLDTQEAKRQIHRILSSQHALAYAALLSTRSVSHTFERLHDGDGARSRAQVQTGSYLCDIGSVTYRLFDEDENGALDPGERLWIDFRSCHPDTQNPDAMIDGALLLTLRQNEHFDEDTVVDYRLSYDRIHMLLADGTSTRMEGDVDLHYALSYGSLLLRIASGSLKIDEGRPFLLQDTQLRFEMDTDTLRYRYSYQGTLSEAGHAPLSFTTPQPLVGYGDTNPIQGTLRILSEAGEILARCDTYGLTVTLTHPDGTETRFYTDWRGVGF